MIGVFINLIRSCLNNSGQLLNTANNDGNIEPVPSASESTSIPILE